MGTEISAALIISTKNSLTNSIPNSFLAALIKHGIWRPERALSFARATEDPLLRLARLTSILELLPSAMRDVALMESSTALRSVKSDSHRAQAIQMIASSYNPQLRGEIENVIRGLSDIEVRASVLFNLRGHIPDDLANSIAEGNYRELDSVATLSAKVKLGARLAPLLKKPLCYSALDTLADDLQRLGSSPDSSHAAEIAPEVLSDLALANAILGRQREAKELCVRIGNPSLVAYVAVGAPPSHRAELIDVAIGILLSAEDYYQGWLNAIKLLAPVLSQAERNKLFDKACSVPSARIRGGAISHLIEYWESQVAASNLTLLKRNLEAIPIGYECALAFSRASKPLTGTAKSEFIKMALEASRSASSGLVKAAIENLFASEEAGIRAVLDTATDDEQTSAQEFVAEMRAFRAERQAGLMPAAENLTISFLQADAIGAMAPYLGNYLEEAYEEVEKLPSRRARIRALDGLGPFLNEALLRRALSSLGRIEDQDLIRLTTSSFARDSGELQNLAIQKAFEITNEYIRAHALLALLPNANEQQRTELVKELFKCVIVVSEMYATRYGLVATSYLSPTEHQVLAQVEAEEISTAYPDLDFVSELVSLLRVSRASCLYRFAA